MLMRVIKQTMEKTIYNHLGLVCSMLVYFINTPLSFFLKINLSVEWNNEVHCLEHSNNNYSNNNNNIQSKISI